HQAATGFRLQLLVARGHHRDLRIGLLVVGRHAFGHAFGRGRGRTVAGIDQGRIEAAERAVELADRRGPETFGERAAQQELVGHLPAQPDLAGVGAAEVGIVRPASGQAQVQAFAKPAVLHQRHQELGVDLAHVVLAATGSRRHAVVLTGHSQGIGLVFAFVLAVLRARGERHRAGPAVEQLAGDVGRGQADAVAAAVAYHRLDPRQHGRRDRAGAAEHVQVDAAADRRARGLAAERLVDAPDVVAAVVGLLRGTLAAHQVDVPVPAARADLEHAVESARGVPGFHLLHEAAWPALHRAAPEQEQ